MIVRVLFVVVLFVVLKAFARPRRAFCRAARLPMRPAGGERGGFTAPPRAAFIAAARSPAFGRGEALLLSDCVFTAGGRGGSLFAPPATSSLLAAKGSHDAFCTSYALNDAKCNAVPLGRCFALPATTG